VPDWPMPVQVLAIAAFAGVVLYLTVFRELRGRGMLPGQRRLLKTGEDARAKVLEASATGSYFGSSGNTHEFEEHAVVLEIQPVGRPSYEIKVKRAIRVRTGANPFWPGREFDVKIDPAHPNSVAIVGVDRP
jgi:hypothetical protein